MTSSRAAIGSEFGLIGQRVVASGAFGLQAMRPRQRNAPSGFRPFGMEAENSGRPWLQQQIAFQRLHDLSDAEW